MSRVRPPRMNPQPHPLAWTPRTPTLTSPDRSGVHGLAIEGQGGKRNRGPGIKNTLRTLPEMMITELIAPCGKRLLHFPGTPSKCLTFDSNQNLPANAQMGCCSIPLDFSHLTFSTKCGHTNFLTTLLTKQIDTTMRERIATDDAVSTLSCFTLYFHDIINIFTQRYRPQRPGTRVVC